MPWEQFGGCYEVTAKTCLKSFRGSCAPYTHGRSFQAPLKMQAVLSTLGNLLIHVSNTQSLSTVGCRAQLWAPGVQDYLLHELASPPVAGRSLESTALWSKRCIREAWVQIQALLFLGRDRSQVTELV